MSPAHRRYLVLEQGVGAAVVNFVINAAIAAILFYGQASVPLWGTQSIAGDTIGTTFFLPLLTCLIVTRVARGQLRGGRPIGLGWTRTSHPLLGWLPIGTFRRGLAFGLLSTALVAPPAVWALAALHVTMLSFGQFIVFKAAFAAALAAVVTPIITVWAIAEGPRAEE
jgi:hypothetical protein